MPLNADEYAARWCDAVGRFRFPTVTFDFRKEHEILHKDMRGAERYVGTLLCSDELRDVRDGLSCVLYWGFARLPLRDRRVSNFRYRVASNTDERLAQFSAFVRNMSTTPSSAADRLLELRRLQLPQFSQMSFATKILMFLDPERYPVLDLRLAKMYAKRPYFPPLQELRYRTSIPMTALNRTCYEEFADWARRTAARVNGISGSLRRDLRAVDIERALFVLAEAQQVDEARILLEETRSQ